MSFSYNDTNLTNILATGTNITLTGYKISGTDMKFLTAFYKDTDNNAVTDLSANMSMFKISNSVLEICPKFTLHATTATGVSISSKVTKMFVVCIGGGGGGGGGGVREPGRTGNGAGGGGGGALNAWIVNFVSGQTTYNVTIGNGGTFGQPNSSSSGILEGAEASSGNADAGRAGNDGGNSQFTYNSQNYISNGGKGGEGGPDFYGEGFGGLGGTVSTTPTPYASRAGGDGSQGTKDFLNTYDKPGGNGGASGNKRGTDTRYLINNNYVDIQPFSAYTAPNTTVYGAADNTYNNDRICYGDGGRGGIGEGDGWGWAGYSGLQGCVIVFFYY